MSTLRSLVAGMAMLTVGASLAHAVEPGEMLSDPRLESRARDVSGKLRCPVCQNQSIDDSSAPLAKDLRRIVRDRILAGDDDASVFNYLTSRYGDYILLNPPMRGSTIMLWLATPLFLLIGIAAIAIAVRRRPAFVEGVSDDDQKSGGDIP